MLVDTPVRSARSSSVIAVAPKAPLKDNQTPVPPVAADQSAGQRRSHLPFSILEVESLQKRCRRTTTAAALESAAMLCCCSNHQRLRWCGRWQAADRMLGHRRLLRASRRPLPRSRWEGPSLADLHAPLAELLQTAAEAALIGVARRTSQRETSVTSAPLDRSHHGHHVSSNSSTAESRRHRRREA